MSKDLKRTFDQIIRQVPPNYYDAGVKTNILQKYWHNKKWQTLSKFLKGLEKGKLLDIGCADGITTYQIYKNFPKLKITGLDYYKKAIDFARKTKPQIKFVVGDAHKLPFKDDNFDIVTTIETLEHLHSPHVVLAEIRRVLKSDGYLIIVQDTNSLLFRTVWWFWTHWKGSVWKNSHINCVKPEILIRNIKKSEFKINKIEFINLQMEVFIKAQKIND